MAVVVTVQPILQRGECVQVLVEPALAGRQNRDADAVVRDRCHVRLRIGSPIHLHAVGPRRHHVMTANAEPPRPRRRPGQPKRRANRRVQPVGGGEIAGAELAAAHRRCVLAHLVDLAVCDLDASGRDRIQQRAVQRGPAHAEPAAVAESSSDTTLPVEIGDAAERLALRMDAEAVQLVHGVRHQAFTARLVDDPAPTLHNHDLESGAGAVDRGGQPGRPAARDQQIDHRSLASASFSTLIRVVSSAALSAVNVSAVIHAVCTSGSATPSRTTAT